MTRWKSFRYRLELAACAWLARVVPRMSRRRAVRFGFALGTAAHFLDRRGRAVAAANVECVYGDRLAPAAKRALVLASYRNFARTMVDLFWGQRLNADNFQQWIRIEGMEELRARMAKTGEGAVYMCLHHGNWEWAGLLGGLIGMVPTTVAENFKNPLLTSFFVKLRQNTGQVMIPQEKALLRTLRAVRKGKLTAILVDLNLRPTQAATVIRAFGNSELEMCVPLIHAILAQRAGALLIPTETQSYPDGTWRIRAHPPLEFPPDASIQEMAQACWDRLEQFIHERPADWLWPYKHFRYQPRNATRPYPFYAHRSGKFEKLRRSVGLK